MKPMRPKIFFINISFLFFFTPSFLFASGSWYGEVFLSDNVIPVDSSLTATTNAQYVPSDPAMPKNLILKGENTSDEIKDITLTLTTSKGGSDSAKVTVFSVNLTADSSTVCAGGGMI